MSGPALSLRDAATIADDAESVAYADLYASAPAALQSSLGLQVQRIAGATLLMAPAMPVTMFNRVIGLGMHEAADALQVRAISQAYRDAGSKAWWVHWNPQGSPAGFEAVLGEMGFPLAQRRSWAKVLRGTEPPPDIPTDLDVARATAAEVLATANAIAAAFEMPPFMADWLAALAQRPRWRIYSVKADGAIVGGGCLYVEGAVAWLGMGSVLPSHRRRGGQGALMALRIADAIAAGARHIVTETGEPVAGEPNPSLANMMRCGFSVVASRLNFAAPA